MPDEVRAPVRQLVSPNGLRPAAAPAPDGHDDVGRRDWRNAAFWTPPRSTVGGGRLTEGLSFDWEREAFQRAVDRGVFEDGGLSASDPELLRLAQALRTAAFERAAERVREYRTLTQLFTLILMWFAFLLYLSAFRLVGETWPYRISPWFVLLVELTAVLLFAWWGWHYVIESADRTPPAETRAQEQAEEEEEEEEEEERRFRRYCLLMGAFALAGVGAVVTILSISYPGVLPALALCAPLGGAVLAVVAASSMALIFLEQWGSQLFTARPDPRSGLLLTLLRALDLLAGDSGSDPGGAVLSVPSRRRLARTLETAARAMESSADPSPRWRPGLDWTVSSALRARGGRVAAWLRERERDIMWPSPQAPAQVEAQLTRALINACLGDWERLEADPPPRTHASRIAAALPRVALAAGLVAAAFLLPPLIGNAAASDSLHVTLFLTALGVLAAPKEVLTEAVSSVPGLLKKS